MTPASMPDAAFFDMDGVLARYDRDAYDPAKGRITGLPLYMDEHAHYFKHCIPDPLAISLFRSCMQAGIPSFILTSVRSDLPWARFDKVAWVAGQIPECDTSQQLIIADGDKAQAIMAARRMSSLGPGMLLVDDFNRNLWDWRRAGGTAVKYLNGVNTPGTYGGPEFDGRLAYGRI